MRPRGPLNKFNVQTKNNLKSNDFKQFTRWNRLSRRRKFPDKMKILTCFWAHFREFALGLYILTSSPTQIIRKAFVILTSHDRFTFIMN